jgi:hypothetical protein
MPVPSFVFDHPTCPNCASPMNFVTRGPHPSLDASWERVSYECTKCENLHVRAVQIVETDVPRRKTE